MKAQRPSQEDFVFEVIEIGEETIWSKIVAGVKKFMYQSYGRL
jgi:hypothetical protein